MIRLFVLDDHPVVSSSLAARYKSLEGFDVVGTAASFQEAMSIVAQNTVDVAVVDVQLDTMLTPRQVTTLAARCRILLFSARTNEPFIAQLLAAGATAVVDKAAPLAELDRVLREVHAGVVPEVSAAPAVDPRRVLSAREYDVYFALARCQTPKEVAASLGLARSTVYCHIESLRRKLGVQTLQEIVARAHLERD